MTLIHPSAVSASAASPREPGLQCGFAPCLLAGCSTCSSNPGRPLPPVSPAAEQPVPYCTTSHSELPRRLSVLHYVAVQSWGTPPPPPWPPRSPQHTPQTHPPPPPSHYQHRHLLFSSLGLKSANPSPVQQTAISVWMEHVARSEGGGCSNWYVWEKQDRRRRRTAERRAEEAAVTATGK